MQIKKGCYVYMSKVNLKTLAYNSIKNKIITCEYAPGTFLNEEALTDELNISRTPIRDALGRLEQEGLVEIKAKRGITVTPLTMKDINMIFEIRCMYEPYIIEHYGTALNDERLAEFYRIFSHPNAESEQFQNNDYYYELDSAFHQMVIDICPNIYMRQNYDLIQTQSERFRFMTGNISNNRLEDTFREHNEIITACLQKDWAAASERMLFHLEESKKATFKLAFDSMMGI
ncbi:GntR family transcriptional regulator [Clostridium sp. MCC353]|uniref:GntR family transcriptional regulator n=1 Tax=Clostridium sp. MCC353 TaxID=2592646 RepID=UPI00207AA565|nr:GntR family transcriptional regulator [Clostridium sp. MCC353]